MRSSRWWLLASLPAATLLTAPAVALYQHRPPAGHTGGFGQPSCASCHFDNPVNAPGGTLELRGVPDSFEGGAEYRLVVVLKRDDMERSGFQLAARFADGGEPGAQAGELRVVDEGVDLVSWSGVQYARQTREGSRLAEEGVARWELVWIAPSRPGRVAFHVAANAANGDASSFGDHIYLHATESGSH